MTAAFLSGISWTFQSLPGFTSSFSSAVTPLWGYFSNLQYRAARSSVSLTPHALTCVPEGKRSTPMEDILATFAAITRRRRVWLAPEIAFHGDPTTTSVIAIHLSISRGFTFKYLRSSHQLMRNIFFEKLLIFYFIYLVFFYERSCSDFNKKSFETRASIRCWMF